MDMTPTLFALAALAVLFAGISKGGFGSGAAFVATPFLAMVIEPQHAVGIMLPLLLLADVVTVKSFWKEWHTPSVKVLLVGSLPGVALAAALYKMANPDLLRFALGVLSLAFVAYQVSRENGWIRIEKRPFSAANGFLAGLVGGFTSFVSHAGGPPVAVFLLSQNMTKGTYQSTTAIVFWIINILKFFPYAMLGIFTAQTLWLDLWLAPVAIIGAMIGVKAHHMVPERAFFMLTYVLLIGTGTKLIWDALT